MRTVSGRLVNAIGLGALLLTLAAPSPARYVCRLGMAQSGPSCPRCQPASHVPSPKQNGPCCELIASGPTQGVAPCSIHVPAPRAMSPLGLSTPTLVTFAPSESDARDIRPAGPPDRSPPPQYLTHLLRL